MWRDPLPHLDAGTCKRRPHLTLQAGKVQTSDNTKVGELSLQATNRVESSVTLENNVTSPGGAELRRDQLPPSRFTPEHLANRSPCTPALGGCQPSEKSPCSSIQTRFKDKQDHLCGQTWEPWWFTRWSLTGKGARGGWKWSTSGSECWLCECRPFSKPTELYT